MKAQLLFVFVLLGISFIQSVSISTLQNQTITKIAFGSCSRHERPQPVWKGVLSFKPDFWVWLGDIVYADTMRFPFYWVPTPLDKVQEKFNIQKNKTEYKELLDKVPVTGLWDDHDFNNNNGGKYYGEKKDLQKIVLDFLDEPKESERRNREGLYGSYTFGPQGKRVKLIMLDTRYFRDTPNMYGTGDMLGEKQWNWFEKELLESDAQVHIITSGIQVLPTDKPVQEKWVNFPSSRKRLFTVLESANVSGAILISGDIHYAEMLKISCLNLRNPLFEITSSGMTHSCGNSLPHSVCRFALDNLMHSTYQSTDAYEFYNFGGIEIFWDEKPVRLSLQVRNQTGEVVLEQQILLDSPYIKKNCLAENPPFYMLWGQDALRDFFGILLSLLVILITACCCRRRYKKNKK